MVCLLCLDSRLCPRRSAQADTWVGSRRSPQAEALAVSGFDRLDGADIPDKLAPNHEDDRAAFRVAIARDCVVSWY